MIKEMEQERQKLKRLEAMGQALATVVHELRNPLCSIELYASMLLEELRGTELESLAKGVSEGVRNMDSFLANALYFAKPRKPKLSKTTLREVVHEVLQLLRPMMEGTGLKLTIELSDRTILADRSLLKQVLLNIFINAIQAMNTEGRIEVKDEQKEGEYLVKIKDTGPGIDESILENIFDPFFTTKPEGTGLGLSISLKIMQLHGGGIRVKSTPGEGSEFVLYFPDSNRPPVNGTTEKTEEAQSNGNNTGGV
ncbi:MAG: hypothetical protein D6778_07620 [Nitrospirae bacterium]|nr:MAG: hypothetical protein D6778_07620 [Nitrospirota bacterium]